MNRIYEEMFILRPDATEEEITPIVEQVRRRSSRPPAELSTKKSDGAFASWPTRLKSATKAYYVLMQFTARPQTVKEVERRLRVNDAVLKYMTVRIDEKLKRIEKRKKEREKRAARKPAPRRRPASHAEGRSMPAVPVARRTHARRSGARCASP